MKVQCVNSSSKKTRKLIKQTFAKLLNEKKELNKVTVTELVKRADITRGTFYTHYDDIYEVAEEYQIETIDLLINDKNILYTKEDILKYFDEIVICLKKNEELYKMLLSSNEPLVFLEKLKKLSTQKIYYALKNFRKEDEYLELTVSFFMAGCISELLKYYINKSDYTLDEIFFNIKNWFEKIFD